MSKVNVHKVIEEIILDNIGSGKKASELVCAVIIAFFKVYDEVPCDMSELIPNVINSMIEENKLIEIEYTVPEVHAVHKSFLLPAGSMITAINGTEYDAL